MIAMMQNMMNITTAITPEEKRKDSVKTKIKIPVTSKIHYQCPTASGYDRSVHLSL